MKIIDEKGKIFGKINVIDFSVILFLVFLAPAFYLLNKIIFMPKPDLPEKWISLEVKFSRMVPEIANVVQENDVEKDEFGETIAKITSIISHTPAVVTDIYEDKFVILDHPFEKDILVSLKVLCVEIDDLYYFKNSVPKMGKTISFNTDLYSITGLIVGKGIK